MGNCGESTIEVGQLALEELVKKIKNENLDWNEADTRFQFIDPFLTDCLGWPKEQIKVEKHEQGKRSDYELGNPRVAIWEAKRTGIYFELPANPSAKILMALKDVILLDSQVKSAVEQVQGYCSSRGTPIAVVCNGHQFIVFLAVRTDGVAPLDGVCIVIDGYEKLCENFPYIWQHLSPQGFQENKIYRLLTTGVEHGIPKKLSTRLMQYPSYRYKSELQSGLRVLAELLIEDVVRSPEVESQFYEKCYCESGSLAHDALISKKILSARYASLFSTTAPFPSTKNIKPNKKVNAITDEVMAEALARRPIVLLGDVGVGKTSFLKHLMHVRAVDEFKNAHHVYVDLASQGAFVNDLNKFILEEIEKQLLERYDLDLFEDGFVRGVLNSEISRHRNSVHKSLYENDKEKYEETLRGFLINQISDKANYYRKAIHHIVTGRKRQVVIMIDNSDQRDMKTQQEAFILSQNLAQEWDCVVFIAVRPQTYHQSRQAGAFTAYAQKVFLISPPRADVVIERRLAFALDMAEGRIPVERIAGLKLELESLSLFLKALLFSLANNRHLNELLSNITGGNIRQVVELIIKFIGCPNVNARKIVNIMKESGEYNIPVHEFSKSAILGDYSHFCDTSTLALNIFDVRHADHKEHFLIPMVLGFLDYNNDHRNREGFVLTPDIIKEMQSWGFMPKQIEAALRRMNNKRLLDTPERITFDEDITGLIGDLPTAFRLTPTGAYHLHRWATDFAYLDAMLFDTPIFDTSVLTELAKDVESFDIEVRYKRAKLFRSYLTKVWNSLSLQPQYFNWDDQIPVGKISFEKVERFIGRGNSPRAKC